MLTLLIQCLYKSLLAEDMDTDGDIDIVIPYLDGFGWYENLDGLGNFDTVKTVGVNPQLNTMPYMNSLYVVDFDNDVVLFSSHTHNMCIADIENDGLKDIISGGHGDALVWNKNLGSLTVEEIDNNNIDFYPNPTTGIIHIKDLEKDIRSYKIIDLKGKVLIEEINCSGCSTIDLIGLDKGVYVIIYTERSKNLCFQSCKTINTNCQHWLKQAWASAHSLLSRNVNQT